MVKLKIVLLVICLLPLDIFAQKNGLSFMGVPLNGRADNFVSRLIKKNPDLKQVSTEEEDVILLKGNFYKFSDVEITIISENNFEKLRNVHIIFNQNPYVYQMQFESLFSDLCVKYGKPLKKDKLNNYTSFRWILKGGMIEYSIFYNSIWLHYYPKEEATRLLNIEKRGFEDL